MLKKNTPKNLLTSLQKNSQKTQHSEHINCIAKP